MLPLFNCFKFDNKVVLIVGGSRGLGLEIARELSKKNAKIVLVAREADELERAKKMLDNLEIDVYTEVCDIREKEQVDAAIGRINYEVGPVDVLINCAGEIEVGPIDTMSLADFENAMKVHFWGPLYTMLAVIPDMRQKKSGRIVNVSSIGGKLSVPHLLPYCASKHAAAGLSHGMRAELMRDNIYVTTVCPGMMRTGSHVNARFKGQNTMEYAWFSIFNALPFTSVSSTEAAKQILQACQNGDAELVISLPAQFATKVYGLFPGAVSDIMALTNFIMPMNEDGNGSNDKSMKTGKESQSAVSPSIVTALSDRAAQRNNQIS